MTLWCLSRCICGDPPLRRVLASRHFWVLQLSSMGISTEGRGKKVRYAIDRMTMSDVPRVVEIERQAYPSTWPPSAYRKELQDNRWAHYIVVRDKHIAEEGLAGPHETEKARKNRLFPLSLLSNRSIAAVPSLE